MLKEYPEKLYQKADVLLEKIKENLPRLEELLAEANNRWGEEDIIYRFYHASWKVYCYQPFTELMYRALQQCSPHEKPQPFCNIFEEIFVEGTGKKWEAGNNKQWTRETRPIIEAFLHSKYFLEMAVQYGKELETVPNVMPSGWAALCELYGIR